MPDLSPSPRRGARAGASRARRASRISLAALALLLVPLAFVTVNGDEKQGVDAAEADPPRLHLPDPVFDWGTAYRGQRIEHTFRIENTGGGPLEIEQIKPQCGCTIATDYERRLLPGESTMLKLTLESGALSGSKEKYTEIISNGLGEDNKLWMQGEVEDLFTIEPRHLRTEAILASTEPPAPEKYRIVKNLEREYRILGAKSRSGRVRAEITTRESEDGPGAYELLVYPNLEKSDRDAFQDDTIDFDVEVGEERLTLGFPVSIVLRERITVEPSRSLYFPAKATSNLPEEGPPEDAASMPRRPLDVRSIGGREHTFKITGHSFAEGSAGIFDLAVDTVEAGRHYRLTVTIRERPGKKRAANAKIVLKTDDVEVPEITIPLTARF